MPVAQCLDLFFVRKRSRHGLSFVEPQMPTLVEKPPEGSDWIHEINGYRTQLLVDRGRARAFTRRATIGTSVVR